MLKKIFALASVTALTGLVASVAASGCSSTTVTGADTADTGTADSSGDSGRKPTGTVDEPDADVAGATCPLTDPLDATTAPWKPPAVDPGKCTEQDIVDLVTYIDGNKSAAYADIKKVIKDAGCAACLFVKDGATWGPLVEKADGTFMRNNFGGCVAVVSGNEACGKSYSQLDDCIDVACQDCADDAARTKCMTAALKGACKTATAAYVAACGDDTAVTACDELARTYTFEAAARALCVGLANDGG